MDALTKAVKDTLVEFTNDKEKAVKKILGECIEPQLKWKIGELNLIRDIRIKNNLLFVKLELITDDTQLLDEFREEAFARLTPFEFNEINIHISKVNVAQHGLKQVENIILVSSGKGGVGKSSIAVNLAASLQKRGFKTGLMDADVYGPSVPILLGCNKKPQVLDEEVLMPVEAHQLKTISVGYLVDKEKALSWRGQLVSGTILQFIRKTQWGELDYLVIDMPPGTGDIQLTVAHELKVKGVLIVAMPQEVVIGDVKRNLNMYREKEVPVLGLIKNMSQFQCEECGHNQVVFPGKDFEIPTLDTIADLPLVPDFCDSGNRGTPYVLDHDGDAICLEFEKIVDYIEKRS